MKRLIVILNRIPELIGMFLLLSLCAVIIANVIARFVFNYGLVWSDEIARYSLIWITFIGSAVLVRFGQHIAIDILEAKMPEKLRHFSHFITHIIITIVAIILIWQGITQVVRQYVQVSPATGLPVGIVYIVIPLSGLYMLIYALNNILKYFSKYLLHK
jgi:TRAP-type C4-dicarboxylate transport system permease small subunit